MFPVYTSYFITVSSTVSSRYFLSFSKILSIFFITFSSSSSRPKDLEAEIARASRRRSLRDPVELLAWADDSMDTVELCRLLQERDAKDEHQRKLGQCSKDNSAM